MRWHLLRRIFNRHTIICYITAVCLMLILVGERDSAITFFQGFSVSNGMGRLDLLKVMEWNLCILPPISASLLFVIQELGVLSSYTVLRTRTIRFWWMVRFAAVIIINYVFFFFSAMTLFLSDGSAIQWETWLRTAALFPLHTTLLSVLCCTGILLFSSRAAVIIYLLIEAVFLLFGLVHPPISLFLIPFWGMVEAMGSFWRYAVIGSLFLFVVLNFNLICWLSRHNPAANPQNK